MQRHLYEHYSSVSHCGFLETIALMDKIDPSNPFKKEDYWRRTLSTMAPYDIIVEDNVWSNTFCFIIVKNNFISISGDFYRNMSLGQGILDIVFYFYDCGKAFWQILT